MIGIDVDKPGSIQLLMGNEAIARGALEAGAGVAAAYPGTPSTEIITTLAKVAKKFNMYVEWSVNEKVALEVCTAASLSGLRAITAMKQVGLNVALDFLANLTFSGINKGLVVVAADDSGGSSSTNEQDSRHIAKILDLPLLEPATFQEAKDMTKWAFELSEAISNACMLRTVTRISHGRGNVVFGELPSIERRAHFDTSKTYNTGGKGGKVHRFLHEKLKKIEEIFESAPFNIYEGPEKPDLLIVTCGIGWLYSTEAVRTLSLTKSVGLLKLGTTWPLPTEFLRKHLRKADKILVVEEVDPFLESNMKEFVLDKMPGYLWTFLGKASGHIDSFGELNAAIVMKAIAGILNVDYMPRDATYRQKCESVAENYVPSRGVQFCPGCPHRATSWVIKDTLKMAGGDGVVTGDIGCYNLAVDPTGYEQIRTLYAMGSGIGIASGLGKMNQFGSKQPIMALCGDSTFFHAAIPGLINAIHNQADLIFVILDNSGTAMTGFQPHPGTSKDAVGDERPVISIDNLCKTLGMAVTVVDPYDIKATREAFLNVLKDRGKTRVVISRRECALIRATNQGPIYKVNVDPQKCFGDDCGCNRYCTRVFKCPGIMWDRISMKAKIDEAVCSGCGVCVDVCSQSAIVREEVL
jgi:indolepyruvate ferredoxin oxidoreductase alpha subunit